MITKSEQIRAKYGKSRWGLTYQQIAEEFDTGVTTVWKAINLYKGLGKGWHMKNLTPEERREYSILGGLASHKSGNGHEWTQVEAIQMSKKAVLKRKSL